MANGEDMIDRSEEVSTIDRREAIRRVGLFLGGVTFVGGSSLLAACQKDQRVVQAGQQVGQFATADMNFLDEVADTILPETKTPGAKAAHVGAFMALMVTDTYDDQRQTIFRDGMSKLNAAAFMAYTYVAPPQPFNLEVFFAKATP